MSCRNSVVPDGARPLREFSDAARAAIVVFNCAASVEAARLREVLGRSVRTDDAACVLAGLEVVLAEAGRLRGRAMAEAERLRGLDQARGAAGVGAKEMERLRILKEVDKRINSCKAGGSLSTLRSLALWIESEGSTK